MTSAQEDIQEAKRVLAIEVKGLQHLSEGLDDAFSRSVALIADCSGKVIVTGVGKSGLIGRKIASTFSSTGTPSLYLHPTESSHGDLGVVMDDDIVVAISYSGESKELNDVLKYCARKGIPLISLTGQMDSTLANASAVALSIAVPEEACPLKLAPTASSTATLALGDALAMALLKRKGFEEKDYAEFHPGGSLGRKLLTRVRDVMNTGDALPLVTENTPLTDVIVTMTGYGKGAAAVVDSSGSLLGAVTDGDVRRRVGKTSGVLEGEAKGLMSKSPKTVDANELAQKALFLMQQFRVNLLFVVDTSSENPKKPIGILHIQDLMRESIR